MTQSSGKSGICNGCGKRLYIRKDGMIKQHMDPSLSAITWYCKGSDKPPIFGTICNDGRYYVAEKGQK